MEFHDLLFVVRAYMGPDDILRLRPMDLHRSHVLMISPFFSFSLITSIFVGTKDLRDHLQTITVKSRRKVHTAVKINLNRQVKSQYYSTNELTCINVQTAEGNPDEVEKLLRLKMGTELTPVINLIKHHLDSWPHCVTHTFLISLETLKSCTRKRTQEKNSTENSKVTIELANPYV